MWRQLDAPGSGGASRQDWFDFTVDMLASHSSVQQSALVCSVVVQGEGTGGKRGEERGAGEQGRGRGCPGWCVFGVRHVSFSVELHFAV